MHEGSRIGCEKYGDAAHVARRADATGRNRVLDVLCSAGPIPHIGGHVSLDQTGCDSVDPYALGCPFDGEHPGQADQAVLGGRIGAHLAEADEAQHRRHVDHHPRAPFQHSVRCRLAQSERRLEIQPQHPLPVTSASLPAKGRDVGRAGSGTESFIE